MVSKVPHFRSSERTRRSRLTDRGRPIAADRGGSGCGCPVPLQQVNDPLLLDRQERFRGLPDGQEVGWREQTVDIVALLLPLPRCTGRGDGNRDDQLSRPLAFDRPAVRATAWRPCCSVAATPPRGTIRARQGMNAQRPVACLHPDTPQHQQAARFGSGSSSGFVSRQGRHFNARQRPLPRGVWPPAVMTRCRWNAFCRWRILQFDDPHPGHDLRNPRHQEPSDAMERCDDDARARAHGHRTAATWSTVGCCRQTKARCANSLTRGAESCVLSHRG